MIKVQYFIVNMFLIFYNDNFSLILILKLTLTCSFSFHTVLHTSKRIKDLYSFVIIKGI